MIETGIWEFINMKKYVAIFSMKPAVRLDPKLGKINLNFREKKPKRVVIFKIEQRVSPDSTIQVGLLFRVFLSASNVEEARVEAKSLVDALASFMTLITGVGLSIPLEELVYEITPNVQEREFIQAFSHPLALRISRRILDQQLLTHVIDRSLKLKPPYFKRIGRAVRWYRMGVMTFDNFDRFNCFWIGLEALNLLLQEKLSIRHDLTVSGVKAFIQQKMPNGKQLYKRIHQLRINIMHSTRELGKLISEVKELAPKTGEILFRAICFLLEVNGWDAVAYQNILERVPTRLELHGTIIGGKPDSLGPEGKDPYFEPKPPVINWKVSKDGTPTFTVEFSFVARLNSNVQWRKGEVRIYGDEETRGELKTEVQKRNRTSKNKSSVSNNESGWRGF